MFTEIYGMLNKLYGESYMMYTGLPEFIKNYYYLSKEVNLSGRYVTQQLPFVDIYIICDDNNVSFKDIMLLGNKPSIVISIPFIERLSHKDRITCIREVCSYIFKQLYYTYRPLKGSTLHTLISNAGDVLPILVESLDCISKGDMLDPNDFITDKLSVDKIENILDYDINELFTLGGLINLI